MRPTLSTKTGDKGMTSLYSGKRLSKASDRIHTYGDVDELNAILGVILAEDDLPATVRTQLSEIQRTLFTLGADLATPIESDIDVQRISEKEIATLEQWGKRLEDALPKLTHFVLPSGSRAGSLLHQARTVCRRAERWMVHLSQQEVVNEDALIYINRLSDYLFLVSRTVNSEQKVEERIWISE